MTSHDPVLHTVRAHLQGALKLSAAEAAAIGREATPATLAGWTSMVHLELLLAVERAHDVTFDADEIASLASVGAIVDAVGKAARR
jgi:acyl carrier protein